MFLKIFAALVFVASPALATVFITQPTASSTFHGGQPAIISWQDDGSVPSLQDFGNAVVSIYVGNAQQQTSLQTVVDNVNVSSTGSIQFTPNGDIGPNSNDYFIRIESLAFKDPKNPQFPALSFSAKFAMDNMSGTFNSTIQAQIAGQSTAPLAGQTVSNTVSANQASTTVPHSTAVTASHSTSMAVSSISSAAATSSSSAALNSKPGWMAIILGALSGVTVFQAVP
ncbi:hypothetical protein Ac2012v2_007709 [Leucoagaricus gongylophorus]